MSSPAENQRRRASATYQAQRPQTRGTVAGEIIAVLRQDIATGVLERGARLPNERELAEQFGVSQPTIREAIRALDAMGLVDVRHGSGAYVRGDSSFLVANSLQTLLQIERVSMFELLDVRAVLGRQSATQAVLHATEEEIDAIDAIAHELADVGNVREVQQIADDVVAFQVACSAAAHNPLLYALETFLIALLMQFQLSAKGKRGREFWLEWTVGFGGGRRRLVDALRARDLEGAQRAMELYLEDQHEAVSSDPELANVRLSDPEALQTVADVMLRLREVPAAAR